MVVVLVYDNVVGVVLNGDVVWVADVHFCDCSNNVFYVDKSDFDDLVNLFIGGELGGVLSNNGKCFWFFSDSGERFVFRVNPDLKYGWLRKMFSSAVSILNDYDFIDRVSFRNEFGFGSCSLGKRGIVCKFFFDGGGEVFFDLVSGVVEWG